MNYAPIGAHGPWCDDGELTRMCDECKDGTRWDVDPTDDEQGLLERGWAESRAWDLAHPLTRKDEP